MQTRHNRRIFMLQVVAGASAVVASTNAPAQKSTDKLTETDPYAKSMGFKLDTNNVDKARYPRHDAATQQCSKCQLFSGKAGEPDGPCSFYGGRIVPVAGWCRNFKPPKAAA
jgi:High potential iron-sulfur protein